jgi:hypothetical protein
VVVGFVQPSLVGKEVKQKQNKNLYLDVHFSDSAPSTVKKWS